MHGLGCCLQTAKSINVVRGQSVTTQRDGESVLLVIGHLLVAVVIQPHKNEVFSPLEKVGVST